MEISKGKQHSATKFILYAPEGFGKSTFASKLPDPLFIDTEGGTKQLDVRRFDEEMNWDNILEAANYVLKNPGCCKTLVTDTLDWAESACITKLNKIHKTENILTMDYGKGSLYVVAEFQKLLDIMDQIINKGINVCMLAHAAIRKQELPEELGAFDHWELKLQSKQVKAKVKEWADILVFGNYKTLVYTDDKTKSKKAQGGERVCYTEHHSCWDAKNRHGLKAELPFEYKSFKEVFEGKSVKKEPAKDPEPVKEPEKKPEDEPEQVKEIRAANIPDKLKELLINNKVSIGEVESIVADKGLYEFDKKLEDYDPDFIKNKLIDKWDGFYRTVLKYRDNNPFYKEDK